MATVISRPARPFCPGVGRADDCGAQGWIFTNVVCAALLFMRWGASPRSRRSAFSRDALPRPST
eukprot:11180126-Lingulodinium_polyedra.AAC.1